jgi:hypothetical protein
MRIIDLDGKEVIVTDLPLAILQADDYRHYRVSNPSAHQSYLYEYWEDVYQKLLLLELETKADN